MTIVLPLECESENRNKHNLHAAYTQETARAREKGLIGLIFDF